MTVAAAAASPEDPAKKPIKVVHKHYAVNLVVNIKRGREEMDFVNKESDRMHKLIEGGTEIDWAKARLERIQDMILNPAEQVAAELTARLKGQDKEDEIEVPNDGVNE